MSHKQQTFDRYLEKPEPKDAAHTHPLSQIIDAGAAAKMGVGTVAGTVAAGDHIHAVASAEADGFMSAGDKAKLDTIAGAAELSAHAEQMASSTTPGHAKAGAGLTAAAGALSVDYGAAAGTACEGNDPRLADSRSPVPHVAAHKTGGADPLAASDVGAVPVDWSNGATGYQATRVLRDVLVFASPSNANVAGTMKISLPVGWNGVMFRAEIHGYDYRANGVTGWTLVLGAYNNAGGGWSRYSASTGGTLAPFGRVRFGYDTARGKSCILLGEPTTLWAYSRVTISELIVTFNGAGAFPATGWTAEIVADENGIDHLVEAVLPETLKRPASNSPGVLTGPEHLSAGGHQIFHVETAGNDADAALYGGTQAHPFATLAAALDYGGKFVSQGVRNVTYQLGAGEFEGATLRPVLSSSSGYHYLQGIDANGGTVIKESGANGYCLNVPASTAKSRWIVRAVKLDAKDSPRTVNLIQVDGNDLRLMDGVIFGECSRGIYATNLGANVNVSSSIKLEAHPASVLFYAILGAQISLASTNVNNVDGTGKSACTWLAANTGGRILGGGSSMFSNIGTLTAGKKYDANWSGVIVSQQAQSAFPGTVAGTLANGGQYIGS